MHESIQNPLFRQLAFNRSNYTHGLNYRERYHTRELMSFDFIFVTNFIHDKNPLHSMIIKHTKCLCIVAMDGMVIVYHKIIHFRHSY